MKDSYRDKARRPGKRKIEMVDADRRIGTQIGNYAIEALLGRGGMGVVYRATHTISSQRVALKLMLPSLSEDEDFRRRFLREADFSPLLDHPGIVRVFEAGEQRGQLFIAMEFVQGTDLKSLISRKGFSDPARLSNLFTQVAGALDWAHESGLVHRDVKPQNILIGSGDHAYVTDFGLIKKITSTSSVTSTGQILGSIHYMAPEAFEGKVVDGRADVYSLGCVLYECLTGEVPFDRDLEVGVLWAHVREERPLVTAKRPDLPAELDTIVARAMAKAPEDRYLTCGELGATLSGALGELSPSAPVPARIGAVLARGVARKPRRATTSYDSHPNERRLWAPSFFPQQARLDSWSPKPWLTTAAIVVLGVWLTGTALLREGGPPGVISDAVSTVEDLFTGSDENSPAASGDMVADRSPKRVSTRRDSSQDGDGQGIQQAVAKRSPASESGGSPATDSQIGLPSNSEDSPVTIRFSYYMEHRESEVRCSLSLPRGSDGVEVLRAAVNQDCIRSFRTTREGPNGESPNGREFLHCINDVCARVTNSQGIVPDTRWDGDWTGDGGEYWESAYWRSGLNGYAASDGDFFTAYLYAVN
ncbi:MAG: serine/threonine protein kinase [Actinobacteria bacterium]|nr:serine/threonine protein kinase [Actinomycetota bacterium]